MIRGKLLNHNEALLIHLENVVIPFPEPDVKVLTDNIYVSSYMVTGMSYITCLINVDMNLGQSYV